MQNSVTHKKECCPYQTQMTCHSNTHNQEISKFSTLYLFCQLSYMEKELFINRN